MPASRKEIAQALGITVSGVDHITRRALAKMKLHLTQRGLTLSDIFPIENQPELSREILNSLPTLTEENGKFTI